MKRSHREGNEIDKMRHVTDQPALITWWVQACLLYVKFIPCSLRSSGSEESEPSQCQRESVCDLLEVKLPTCEKLCRIFAAVTEKIEGQLESKFEKKFKSHAGGKCSDFERQKQKESMAKNNVAVNEKDEIHYVLMEVEPLLEPPGNINWR